MSPVITLSAWKVAACALLLALATMAAAHLGASLAWQPHREAVPMPTPASVAADPDALSDIADEAAQLTGTDAGLITEPATLAGA